MASFSFSFFGDEPIESGEGLRKTAGAEDSSGGDSSATKAVQSGLEQPCSVVPFSFSAAGSWTEKPLFPNGLPCAAKSDGPELLQGIKQVLPSTAAAPGLSTDLASIASTRDVEPGSYEGGFKTWECTKDVIQCLACHPELISHDSLVVDLGCGTGLAGCAALLMGARVVFQDLNADVLSDTTTAHIAINTPSASTENVALVAGPWRALPGFLPRAGEAGELPSWATPPAHLVVSCETLYRVEYLTQFTDALLACMGLGSTAILGTKRYYFGVGGGTDAWILHLQERFGGGAGPGTLLCTDELPHMQARMCVQSMQTVEDGGSNVRDVLKVTLQRSSTQEKGLGSEEPTPAPRACSGAPS